MPEEAGPATQKRTFTTDVLTIAGGTFIAQVITVLASPLITRLFSPEAFGVYALFSSVVTILGGIACLRYDQAIMLPADTRDAVNLFFGSILNAFAISILLVPVFMVGGEYFTSLISAPGLLPYLLLVPLFIFINGFLLALNNWNSRNRRFKWLSASRISKSVMTAGGQVGGGLAGIVSGGGLIFASIAGQAIQALVLGVPALVKDRRQMAQSVSFRGISAVFSRYRHFLLFDTVSSLMAVISWQLPSLLLSAFFSTSVVGFYALAFGVLWLPMSLIGGSIGQVFYPRAAEAHRNGDLAPLAGNVFHVLLKISAVPLSILACTGQEVFGMVFGAAWTEAGLYAQLLSITIIFWFVSAPLGTIMSVVERLRLNLIFNLISIIVRGASLVAGGLTGDPLLAIALFSVSGVLVSAVTCGFFLKLAGVPLTRSLLEAARILAAIVPIAAVLLVSGYILPPVAVVVLAAAFLALYYLVLVRTDPLVRELIGQSGIPFFSR